MPHLGDLQLLSALRDDTQPYLLRMEPRKWQLPFGVAYEHTYSQWEKSNRIYLRTEVIENHQLVGFTTITTTRRNYTQTNPQLREMYKYTTLRDDAQAQLSPVKGTPTCISRSINNRTPPISGFYNYYICTSRYAQLYPLRMVDARVHNPFKGNTQVL